VLDHILVSPAARPWLTGASPLHIDADFPYNPYSGDPTVVWRTSDHDPVAATFAPPLLSIAKSVALTHDPAQPGDPITYTIVVSNAGETDAANVHITDTLPSGIVGSNVDVTQTVTAGSSVTIIVTATVASNAPYGAVITNTAYYAHSTGSGSTQAALTVATSPDLTASTKASSTNQPVRPGDLITYTITLTNSGQLNATVRITDVLGLYYTVYNRMSLTESPTGTLTWQGVVTVGQSVTLQFVARVVADLTRFKIGQNLLSNTMTVNDGLHAPFAVSAPNPPWVNIYGTWLPLVVRH
jgi:uncharacterized repeat protein (TIGR01451 family)